MNTNVTDIYIDHNIPLEKQIAFLRQSFLNFQFDVFEVLKERLGQEGVEIFKAIFKKGYKKSIEKYKDKSFEEIKKVAGIPERFLGFQTEHDHIKSDEVQYSITLCPFLEESKRRGLDMEFCNTIEDVEMEEVSKNLGELIEPTRMCKGDNKCTIKIRNTLGK